MLPAAGLLTCHNSPHTQQLAGCDSLAQHQCAGQQSPHAGAAAQDGVAGHTCVGQGHRKRKLRHEEDSGNWQHLQGVQ